MTGGHEQTPLEINTTRPNDITFETHPRGLFNHTNRGDGNGYDRASTCKSVASVLEEFHINPFGN